MIASDHNALHPVEGDRLGVFEGAAGSGFEIGGDAGRVKHVAAEFLFKAGLGGTAADHTVGFDPVHRLAGECAGAVAR
jgi:hypothetical protein